MGITPPEAVRRARLVVPDLQARPFIGTGCCVLPASEIVCESIGQVPGVRSVECDEGRGVVGLEYEGTTDPLPVAVAVLADLGYPVASVE